MRALIAGSLACFIASACDTPRACTLIGCSSAVGVEANALSDAAFTAVVESDTVNGSVSCAAADENGERGAPTDTSGDIAREETADGATVGATCNARGITLRVLLRDDADVLPTRATITLTSGAETFTADANPVIYDVSLPNGPECEPTCSVAVLFATAG